MQLISTIWNSKTALTLLVTLPNFYLQSSAHYHRKGSEAKCEGKASQAEAKQHGTDKQSGANRGEEPRTPNETIQTRWGAKAPFGSRAALESPHPRPQVCPLPNKPSAKTTRPGAKARSFEFEGGAPLSEAWRSRPAAWRTACCWELQRIQNSVAV